MTTTTSEAAALKEGTAEAPVQLKRRRKRHDKNYKPNYDIPGVRKLILDELTQDAIGCIAGENVTTEKPWISIEKDLILSSLDAGGEVSEFYPIKDELYFFVGNEILMGYIPDESRDYDEFYICLTEEATDIIKATIEKVRRTQEHKLQNAINKKIKRWKTLGSENEIEEAKLKVHRTFLEVEIESKYPILPFEVKFVPIEAQDKKDGYLEFKSRDDSMNYVARKQIDNGVQVRASSVINEAQTNLPYPKNNSTQYIYECNYEFSEEAAKNLEQFVFDSNDTICEVIRVNDRIDLYKNDYDALILNPKYTVKVDLPETVVYLSFLDKNLSENKMISHVSWHKMWTGCVAVSYVDVAPSLYIEHPPQKDEVLKAVHDKNPVLFWSFKDDLKPKLILETPRPIYMLSCCPYNENLILGGCVNGQVILWDITNKLTRVEEEEILSVEAQEHRRYMFSLMSWMKNIFDLSLVRPTALSDLKYSHSGCINGIGWMSPLHAVSRTGAIEESETHSLQFLTSSEDGSIMVWDLLKKPIIAPGGFKKRRLRRLNKRPSALLVDDSPFKILHLNLKPIYKISLNLPLENQRIIAPASATFSFFKPIYELSPELKKLPKNLNKRLIYKPVISLEQCITRQSFFVGTMEGDFVQAGWDGQEFDSGEIVNWESCKFISFGKYHDGPVVSVDYSPSNNAVLTVGGRVFAVWKEEYKDHPIVWRKCKSLYTHGCWLKTDQSSFKTLRMDGFHEIWSIFYQSKSPLQTTLLSNGSVTMMSTHPRKLREVPFGLCDLRGAFRIFYRPCRDPKIVRSRERSMDEFLDREIERKKAFREWQQQWNKRNEVKVETTQIEDEKPEFLIDDTEEKPKKKVARKVVPKIVSAGLRYLQTVQDQHRQNEQDRIKSVILARKQLNTEKLLRESEPMRRLLEENEIKKRKQRHILKESDHIFNDTVAMYFPAVVKKKPPPPPDPYEDSYGNDLKQDSFTQFEGLAIGAQDYIEDNPFNYEFNWRAVIKLSRERRNLLNDAIKNTRHKKRVEEIVKTEPVISEITEEEISELEQEDMSDIMSIY